MKRAANRLMAAMLCVLFFVSAFCAGAYISCVAEEEVAEYAMPILMYHHILQEKSKQGKFVISPEEFEADLLYLKENGYQTVGIRDLLAYQDSGIPLPEKPVMLTFDDGYLSYMEYAVPLLEQYHMKAVVSVVGAYCDAYEQNKDRCVSYAYMNYEDLRILSQSKHTELGNHTYDLHKVSGGRKGCARKKGEDAAAYRDLFTQDIGKMQTLLREQTGNEVLCFTYPFGFCCGEAKEEISRMGFRMSLSCEEGVNFLRRNSSLFHLKRFNREHGRSAESIFKKQKS